MWTNKIRKGFFFLLISSVVFPRIWRAKLSAHYFNYKHDNIMNTCNGWGTGETYPLYVIIRSSRPMDRCLRVQLKEERLHIPIKVCMSLPRLRSIASMYVPVIIFDNEYSWSFVISAIKERVLKT